MEAILRENVYKYVRMANMHKTVQGCACLLAPIILMLTITSEFVWLFAQLLQIYMEILTIGNAFKHALQLLICMLIIQLGYVFLIVLFPNLILQIDLPEGVF